jgi:hypothetical protein
MMSEICKVNVGSTKKIFNCKKDAYSHTKRNFLQDSKCPYPYASYAFAQKIVNTVMLLTVVQYAS